MTHNFEMYWRHKPAVVREYHQHNGGGIKPKSTINGIDVIQRNIKVEPKYGGPLESINGNQAYSNIQTQQDVRNEQLGLINPFAKSRRTKKGAGVRLNI